MNAAPYFRGLAAVRKAGQKLPKATHLYFLTLIIFI